MPMVIMLVGFVRVGGVVLPWKYLQVLAYTIIPKYVG